MTHKFRDTSANLRGIGRLAIDATLGITDLIEALHHNIGGQSGITPLRQDGRTSGLTGMVYNTIRGTTRIAGYGIDRALQLLAAPLTALNDRPEREHLQSAINGVLGDHLVASDNPLAITMTLRKHGKHLELDRETLAAALPEASSKVLLMVHGLCMNDLQWRSERPDGSYHDHGVALQESIGLTAIYLHYNTGQPIAVNGRHLSDMLESLIKAWPVEVTELNILGHSMGGLVTRSAHQQGEQAGHGWIGLARNFIFLGTPHHGAPLERGGHWFDMILGATPYAAPFAKIGKIRSAGITDLRHGGNSGAGIGLPALPTSIECFTIAGVTENSTGDGLVPLDSALGLHDDPREQLNFRPENRIIVDKTHHLQLLSHEKVYVALETILKPDSGAVSIPLED